jgi:acetyltransferase-like isoleucine patch superfamily enzyme
MTLALIVLYILIVMRAASFLIGFCISFAISRYRKGNEGIQAVALSTSTGSSDSNKSDSTRKCLREHFIGFAFGIEKRTLYNVSRLPSHALRNFAYRHIFKLNMVDSVVIYGGVVLRCPSRITIGKGSIIGDRCELDGRGGLYIGENCNLSSEVRIWTAQHDSQSSQFDYVTAPVKIGDRCWVSSNTIILPGISMGDGSVLAAGAVLTKDAEPYGIYAGVPARKIGERNRELKYNFDGSHDWFI